MDNHDKIKFPIIDGIIVDIMDLMSIEYICDPKICNNKKACCASYLICITKTEVDKIITQLPEISKFAPNLKDGDEYHNIFEEGDDDLIHLETDENFRCELSWKNKSGDLLCSLHSQAIKNNSSFYDTKPRSCCLWPLAESDSDQKSLTIQSDCIDFPCIKKKSTMDYKLSKEIALIIKSIYGLAFLNKVEDHMKKLEN